MIAHLLIIFINVFIIFYLQDNNKAFLSLSWVEKWEFRLVYMYGKKVKEENKKEKGNRRGK